MEDEFIDSINDVEIHDSRIGGGSESELKIKLSFYTQANTEYLYITDLLTGKSTRIVFS